MLITLTTDFGLRDAFVGVMKGVIARINPEAYVIDLTHGIPAQDILAGALTLRHSVAYFPSGTIHVAVIDPGVGSARRPLLIESDGNFFIGPDNGVLSLAVRYAPETRIVQLTNPAYQLQPGSSTFHGRDIFAPAAAYLSRGVAPAEFGETLDSLVKLSLPQVSRAGHELAGEVIYSDKFGNLFTNIEPHDLTDAKKKRLEIAFADLRIYGLAANYAAAGAGQFVAVINSWGFLEIALNHGNAAERLGAKVGDKVTLTFRD
ncbi:MAG: S-adenosyl-l-methionine hydroxide adenosyltransferase family protein [Chloroflexota bacterium]|jgi:S-adenosylmethionine hydrolase